MELRNDPIDQNQPRKHTINITITDRRPMCSEFSGGSVVGAMEFIIAICATKSAPKSKRKICQCLARRNKLVTNFISPPNVHITSPLVGLRVHLYHLDRSSFQVPRSPLIGMWEL